MNHKRYRPKRQRAGCNCGTKGAKNTAHPLRGVRRHTGWGSHRYQVVLAERAKEADWR